MMKTTIALSVLSLTVVNLAGAAGQGLCASKAESFVFASAAIEPGLRGTNLKASYSEGVATVGEGEQVVLEKYIYSPNEISDLSVSLIRKNCRLKSIDYSVGE